MFGSLYSIRKFIIIIIIIFQEVIEGGTHQDGICNSKTATPKATERSKWQIKQQTKLNS